MEIHLVANEGPRRLFSGAIGQSIYRPTTPLPEQQEVNIKLMLMLCLWCTEFDSLCSTFTPSKLVAEAYRLSRRLWVAFGMRL